jgi:heme oxygenase
MKAYIIRWVYSISPLTLVTVTSLYQTAGTGSGMNDAEASLSDRSIGSVPDAIGTLRSATRHRHELLHCIMPLSVESAEVGDYLLHLSMLREWLTPIDAWLRAFADGPRDNVSRSISERIALIDADLAYGSLHVKDHIDQSILQARVSGYIETASPAYRWGVCYVVEGSQLGGTVLYKHLKERLAPHPLRFLQPCSESSGAHWKAFVSLMANELCTPEAIREACNGAADAFDRLIDIAQRPDQNVCFGAG